MKKSKASNYALNDVVICSIGTGINALALVRDLGENGLRVHVVAGSKGNLARRSKHCHSHVVLGKWTSESLMSHLMDVAASRTEQTLLIVDNDPMIAALSVHATILEGSYRLANPIQIGNELNDKNYQHRLAIASDVLVPKQWTVDSWKNVMSIADQYVGPLIAKPMLGAGAGRQDFKVIKGDDVDHLVVGMRRVTHDPSHCLVQQFIPGGDRNIRVAIGYRSADPERSVMITGIKVRQSGGGAGGVAAVVLSSNDADVIEATNRILDSSEYHGLYGLEYKVSEIDGLLYFIELNTRTDGFHGLASGLGEGLATHAYRDLIENKSSVLSRHSEEELYWINWRVDHVSFIKNTGRVSWTNLLKPYFSRKVWAVYQRRDSWPWICSMGLFLCEVKQRVVRRLSAEVASAPDRQVDLHASKKKIESDSQ